MTAQYKIKTVRLSDGERMPILLDRDGQPLYDVLLFTLTVLRTKHLASNTIEGCLRSLILLYLVLEQKEVDIHARLQNNHLLSSAEIDLLVRLCHLPLKELHSQSGAAEPSHVAPSSAATRLRNIRDYLLWLGEGECLRPNSSHCHQSLLQTTLEIFSARITALVPVVHAITICTTT